MFRERGSLPVGRALHRRDLIRSGAMSVCGARVGARVGR